MFSALVGDKKGTGPQKLLTGYPHGISYFTPLGAAILPSPSV